MEYRQLGKWGMRVSALGFGTYLTVGYTVDEDESRRLINTAYEGGINYFDTANAYAQGEAERVLGKYLRELPRHELVVLTKVWAPMGTKPNDHGLSAKHVREQCDASLKRLGMEYVDIYMCHRPDPDTPLEETVRAMEDLARAGKIIYWGVSEWPAEMVARANEIARRIGARPIAVSQPRYNLLFRNPELNLFPTTAKEGIGNVIFSPLAHGMLTGKYRPGTEPPEGSRAADPRQNGVMKNMYWSEENLDKSAKLAELAEQIGVSAAELAIAWCLKNQNVASVILGASNTAQLEQNLRAANLELSPETDSELDILFPLRDISGGVR
jgi:voltage-dependent potassium channel beta subunit